MLKSYIKTTLRHLWKHRLFSFLNLFGLALGLTVTVVILLYVQAQLSHDSWHRNGDRIYRVLRKADLNDSEYLIGVTSAPFAPALENDFPESIEETVRVLPDRGLVTYSNHNFLEDKLFLADANFFEVFSFPLARGEPSQVLATPNSIVLTQAVARKYFGETDPIGKTLTVDESLEYVVTGVLAAEQPPSHLDFDLVGSIESVTGKPWFSDWWNNNLLTYAVIETPREAERVEAGLPSFIDKYLGADFQRTGKRIDPTLQPLADIYFGKDVRYDPVKHGDRPAVVMFALVASIILMLACINYMNLTTARAGRRAQEIGVRKTFGAHRPKLMLQFFFESLLLTLAAILAAIAATEILLPWFNAAFSLDLGFHLFAARVWLALAGLLLVVSLLASSYPSLVLSGFRPVAVLRTQSLSNPHGVFIRKGLVVVQFCISVLLVASTIVIGQQLSYMRTKDLGFNKEHLVLVRFNNRDIREQQETFAARLRTEPDIVAASAMSGPPGGFHDTMAFTVEGKERNWRMRTVFTDPEYVKTLGLKIVAGRNFSREFGTDTERGVLLNETAVKTLGWGVDEVIGKEIQNVMVDSTRHQVVGVVQDFHFSSLRSPIEPLAIALRPWGRVVAVRVEGEHIKDALAAVQRQWQRISPAYPCEMTFMDETFAQLYKEEQTEARLFRIFAGLSITIACLGLFGLATFTAEQRTKEIGIRKVLGATVANVVALLSKDFVKLVLLANLVAWPLAFFAMNRWLQNYAYRIELGWWVFLLAGGLALIIALVTVSTQAIRAALANPVESLRYE